MNTQRNQRILSVLILAALMAMLLSVVQMAHGQIAATVTTSIDGKAYSGQVMLQPATVPAVQPGVTVTIEPDVPAVLAEMPTRLTTGVEGGITLKSSLSLRPAAGTVIENMAVTGTIDASAGNITIRNCRVDGNGNRYAVYTHGAKSTVTIENCEIYNVSGTCVYGENIILRECYVHDSDGDAIKCNLNGLFERNLIEKLGRSSSAHADGVQIEGGDNVVIRDNHFNAQDANGYKINSPVFIQGAKSSGKPSKNILIQGNWIRYGQYGVRPRSDYGQAATIEVKANVFFLGTFRSSCGAIENGVKWTANLSDKGVPVQPGDK